MLILYDSSTNKELESTPRLKKAGRRCMPLVSTVSLLLSKSYCKSTQILGGGSGVEAGHHCTRR
jgi:hypothetical protein